MSGRINVLYVDTNGKPKEQTMKIGDKVTVRDWSYSKILDAKTGALVESGYRIHGPIDNQPFTVTAVGLRIFTEQWLSKDKYADTAIRDEHGTIIYTQERFLEPVVEKPFPRYFKWHNREVWVMHCEGEGDFYEDGRYTEPSNRSINNLISPRQDTIEITEAEADLLILLPKDTLPPKEVHLAWEWADMFTVPIEGRDEGWKDWAQDTVCTFEQGHNPQPNIYRGRRYILRRKVKQYRPWTIPEVPYGTAVRWKVSNQIFLLVPAPMSQDAVGVLWVEGYKGVLTSERSPKQLFDYAVQLDGSPCGILRTNE